MVQRNVSTTPCIPKTPSSTLDISVSLLTPLPPYRIYIWKEEGGKKGGKSTFISILILPPVPPPFKATPFILPIFLLEASFNRKKGKKGKRREKKGMLYIHIAERAIETS